MKNFEEYMIAGVVSNIFADLETTNKAIEKLKESEGMEEKVKVKIGDFSIDMTKEERIKILEAIEKRKIYERLQAEIYPK